MVARFALYRLRSIPAWAGETYLLFRVSALQEVYPRVGGGNFRLCCSVLSLGGLSPRGRGKPVVLRRHFARYGSIPAWAGETTRRYTHNRRFQVYPRVGGGNPSIESGEADGGGLSPRGRGKRSG